MDLRLQEIVLVARKTNQRTPFEMVLAYALEMRKISSAKDKINNVYVRGNLQWL